MKKLITAFAILGLALCGGQAVAEIGTIDDVPAASMLLPYFEVDLNDPDGVTTLFSINNASAAPAIAHVTLWTDLSVETLDFSIYLTGYDVQTINLRDIFNGNMPQSAHPSVDATFDDTLSPSPPEGSGQAGFWDDPADATPPLNTAACNGILPLPDLPASLEAHIRNSHTGNPSAGFANACSAQPFDDGIARGYITIDSVTECTRQFPNSAGYWGQGGTGIANNRNILWGDYFIVDRANNFAQGENLVHLEADAQLGGTDSTYTFYGRWDNAALGIDNREPLATSFATRYLGDLPPFDGTDLVVWRDGKFGDTAGANGPFSCGDFPLAPDWYPLDEAQVAAFDEEERVAFLCGAPEDTPFSDPFQPSDVFCFPAETQRIPVAGAPVFADPLDVPFDFGWMFLNLNHDSGTYRDGIAQNWVTTLMSSEGRFSVGLNAIQLDNANDYGPDFDVLDTPTIADPDDGPGGGL